MTNIEDRLISLAIILFILSLISERFSNFLKLYLPEKIIGNLKVQQINPFDEKLRERRILLINIICGFLISFTLNVDLIEIFNSISISSISSLIGWSKADWPYIVRSIPGLILTGFFLSFGSKFWHDLLDLLLQFKNLKKKLVDEKTYEISAADELNTYLSLNDDEIVEKTLEENREKLLNIKGVHSLGVGYKDGKPYIEAHCDSKELLLPKILFYRFPNGKIKTVSINIVNSDNFSTYNNIGPSSEISNKEPVKNASGSLGCLVKKEENDAKLILTCYHVVKHKKHKWESFNIIDQHEEVVHPLNGAVIGRITEGVRDHEKDIALIEPIEPDDFSSIIPNIGIPTFYRSISSDDKKYGTNVRICGNLSGFREGKIAGQLKYATVTYPGKSYWIMNNLIIIKSLDNKPFSKPGDSGSIVLDEYDYAIGVIVSGNQNISLAIPIDIIMKELKIKFY